MVVIIYRNRWEFINGNLTKKNLSFYIKMKKLKIIGHIFIYFCMSELNKYVLYSVFMIVFFRQMLMQY